MSKKQGKKNKNKNSNYNAQKQVVAEDLADDVKAEQTVEYAEVENNLEAEKPVEAKKEQKAEKGKKDQKNKKQAKKEPKPNRVKESVAELKKVTWPTFNQVVKNTLLVLGIVLIFTIVLFGIDYGLSWIYKLLTPAA